MKHLFTFCFLAAAVISLGIFHYSRSSTNFEEDTTVSFIEEEAIDALMNPYKNWQRPAGPLRVALQVGHWKNQELPDEFERLRETGGGTRGGGKAEWEVNLAIAQAAAPLLQAQGIVVDILPATIPPAHYADVFVSIHADGSENSTVSGYKVAAPRRDITDKADELASFLQREYGKLIDLPLDPNITRNMRGYYAFNWRRYEHSLHPMTVAAIFETGFLTSPRDQKILINQPELAAQAIVNGIMAYFTANPIS